MPTWTCPNCREDNPEGTRFCGHCGAAAAPVAGGGPGRPVPAPDSPLVERLRGFVAAPVAARLLTGGGRLGEDRRLVTALFADISGFSQLTSRLDPEQLVEIVDPVIERLSDVVGRYEGYIEKYAGDALMALFGAPVSHEDDAGRALRVAQDMHRELELLKRQLPPEAASLALHIGVNTGHVVARILGSQARLDYAVLGDTVVLAQRLEAAAPNGQTYVGDTTRRLTMDSFDFEPLEELRVKGKEQPVTAWRLAGERARGAGARVQRMVGREAELARVRDAVDGLAAGRGGVVTIAGAAGLGKSTLGRVVRAHAMGSGITWLRCRCLAYNRGLAYGPYVDLLRRIFRVGDDPAEASVRLRAELADRGLQSSHALLARLLGVPGEAVELEPEAVRRWLHDALVSLLVSQARQAPVVLQVEDVHWADASTRELTEDIARATDAAAVLLLVTARPDGAGPLSGIRAHAGSPVIEVVLDRLDRPQVDDIVTGLLGGSAAPELLELIWDRSEGNPFFVEEVVAALEGGLHRDDQGRWTMAASSAEVPHTIEGVIGARLDALSGDDAQVIQAAAVLGRRVDLALLSAVAGRVEPALGRLVGSGLLDRVDDGAAEALVFHHALIQEVAYGRLLRRRQRELHLLTARAAEALYGDGEAVIEVLARHYHLGGGGIRAYQCLTGAAARARRLFANQEAIAHLRDAAAVCREEPGLNDRLPAVLLELGGLEELIGDYPRAAATYAEVRRISRDPLAWGGSASVLRRQGDPARALSLIDEALGHGVADDRRPLLLEKARCLQILGQHEEAATVLGEALEDGPGSVEVITGHLLLQLARVETVTERLEGALAHAQAAQAVFEAHDDLAALTTTLRMIGGILDSAQRYEEAAAILRRSLALAERVGSTEEIGGSLINLGLVEMARGNLDEAVECDRRAIAAFRRIGHGALGVALANLAEKLDRQGSHEEALSQCEAALTLARRIGNQFVLADAMTTAASIRLHLDEPATAVSMAEQAGDLFMELGNRSHATRAFDLAADALEAMGERERAVEVRARARG